MIAGVEYNCIGDGKTSPVRLIMLLARPIAIALGCWIYLAIMNDDMSAISGMSLPVLMFVSRYALALIGFSFVVAEAQAGLTNIAYMSPIETKAASGSVAGRSLVGARLYQLSPLKQFGPRRRRSPLSFLLTQ